MRTHKVVGHDLAVVRSLLEEVAQLIKFGKRGPCKRRGRRADNQQAHHDLQMPRLSLCMSLTATQGTYAASEGIRPQEAKTGGDTWNRLVRAPRRREYPPRRAVNRHDRRAIPMLQRVLRRAIQRLGEVWSM